MEKSTKGKLSQPHFSADILLTQTSIDKSNGRTVAIKVIDVESAEDEVDDIIQEIAILSELNSNHVTKYYGSYLRGSDLWIIMEFCAGGSCADLMKPGPLNEKYICIILRELLMGLRSEERRVGKECPV